MASQRNEKEDLSGALGKIFGGKQKRKAGTKGEGEKDTQKKRRKKNEFVNEIFRNGTLAPLSVQKQASSVHTESVFVQNVENKKIFFESALHDFLLNDGKSESFNVDKWKTLKKFFQSSPDGQRNLEQTLDFLLEDRPSPEKAEEECQKKEDSSSRVEPKEERDFFAEHGYSTTEAKNTTFKKKVADIQEAFSAAIVLKKSNQRAQLRCLFLIDKLVVSSCFFRQKLLKNYDYLARFREAYILPFCVPKAQFDKKAKNVQFLIAKMKDLFLGNLTKWQKNFNSENDFPLLKLFLSELRALPRLQFRGVPELVPLQTSPESRTATRQAHDEWRVRFSQLKNEIIDKIGESMRWTQECLGLLEISSSSSSSPLLDPEVHTSMRREIGLFDQVIVPRMVGWTQELQKLNQHPSHASKQLRGSESEGEEQGSNSSALAKLRQAEDPSSMEAILDSLRQDMRNVAYRIRQLAVGAPQEGTGVEEDDPFADQFSDDASSEGDDWEVEKSRYRNPCRGASLGTIESPEFLRDS